MAPDDRHPASLVGFAQDLGAIKQGVKSLEDGQREVDRKITGLQRTVGHLVTKDDCKAARADLTDRIKRQPSGATGPVRPGLLETTGRKAGAVAAILALASMVVGGLVVLSRFVAGIEQAIEASRAEQAQRTSQVLDELRAPRNPIIIRQLPAEPDAGRSRYRRRRRRGASQ